MSQALPDDILHLLCEQLAEQEQFDTLFNCATTSRALAVPALTHLYRAHHKAPVRGGGEDETVPQATKLLFVQKWSIMWKSLIASSLGATLFPYCRYIRMLDFRDLENLLDDDQFKVKISKQFFAGPLAPFYKADTMKRANGRKYERLNIKAIIDAIGEAVTQHTPTLEMISGQLNSSALIRWVPRLPRLQGLELWDGSALEDALVPACIHEHCPNFNSLMIFTWYGQDRDHKFSQFISAMRPNSLKAIYTISDVGAAAETFLALSSHGRSLTELRISVSNDSMPHLSLLAGCASLEALRIEDAHGTIVLEETQNDVFLETINWLRNCENLERLSFVQVLSASALVTPVLLEHKIHLRNLEIDSYVLSNSRQFHQALVHQKDSLSFLSLSGDTDGMFRDDVDILVDSVKQLTQLKVLRLLLQEVFHEEHLMAIIANLSLLEELYVNGLELTDRILDFVGNLGNLRSATLAGISKFTIDGLLEFVSRLGPGNQGIRVMIDMADPDTMLPDEQVTLIRESLWEKADGTLDYTLWRDPNVSEFEGDSD
ncbi:hypothetical protein K458DRAFT_385844 [Lentithecium fluviatile CBS 122367]|uniref:F-box domain-containing protein n=1 Tax=Lentithecium fluviatile CBS 122367 TaxID=1168545 RepID=A0A6G1J919_9PLEO|nr:hypothetical protein K458DRAFT_385844 [Lentithecium fluviatile CBS 122367]